MKLQNLICSFLAASLFALFSPMQVKAAPVQKTTCNFGSVPSCSLANPVAAGDLLLLAVHGWVSATPSDALKNVWAKAVESGTDSIWYSVVQTAGADSVATGTGGFGELIEYSGFAGVDVASAASFPSGATTVASGTVSTSAPGELIVGALFSSGYSGVTPGVGFTDEASFSEEVLEDEVQTTSGPTAATFTQPSWSGTSIVLMAAFKTGLSANKTPSLPSVSLAVTGTLLWDTGAAILPGNSFTVNQVENGSQVGIGTIASDSSGNLSGTIAVNPNFTDTKGNVVLQLTLSAGIPVGGSETIQVSEFEQGSTGIVLHIVIFHTDKTVPGSTLGPLKSFSYALVP